jgi:Na+-transporting methylmalonyl-CoA/oxaloacetate decarboxylase gamma subunit
MDVGPFIIQSLWMYGLAIVIAVLAAILIRVIVMVLASRHREAPQQSTSAPAYSAGPAQAAKAEDAAGDVAAIAAAVYAALGMARIVRIEPATRSSWAAQGRQLHHASHDVHHHHH